MLRPPLDTLRACQGKVSLFPASLATPEADAGSGVCRESRGHSWTPDSGRVAPTICLLLQTTPQDLAPLDGGGLAGEKTDLATRVAGREKEKAPSRGRGLGLAWRGRAHGRFTGSRASGLDSQRAPLIGQQLTNPPEPLGGNNTLHPLLDTLRGRPGLHGRPAGTLGQARLGTGCQPQGPAQGGVQRQAWLASVRAGGGCGQPCTSRQPHS